MNTIYDNNNEFRKNILHIFCKSNFANYHEQIINIIKTHKSELLSSVYETMINNNSKVPYLSFKILSVGILSMMCEKNPDKFCEIVSNEINTYSGDQINMIINIFDKTNSYSNKIIKLCMYLYNKNDVIINEKQIYNILIRHILKYDQMIFSSDIMKIFKSKYLTSEICKKYLKQNPTKINDIPSLYYRLKFR